MPSTMQGSSRGSMAQYLAATVRVVDPSETQSVHRYLHSAQLLLQQANVYRKAGNEEQLYVMLLRFASLMLETVPKHPKFQGKDKSFLYLKQTLKNSCIQELEELKLSLSLKPVFTPKNASPKRKSELIQFDTPSAPTMNWSSETVPHVNNGSLMDAQPSPSMAPPPNFYARHSTSAKGDTLEKHGLFDTPRSEASQVQPPPPNAASAPSLGYPSVEAISLIDAEPPMSPAVVNPPPEIQLGPQQLEVQHIPTPSGPPDPSHNCSAPPPVPSVDPVPTKKPVVKREDGLREVQISLQMMELFLRHAESNTVRGIETCAVLAGELGGEDNVLRINHIILPPQKGSRDQVEMLNEEILLEETLEKGLIVMGWIHTHPEFQCFLSSVDVHTTLGFQILMEEALAIVMAPKDTKRKCGVFRLTTPGGMDLIQACPHRGFHTHPPTKTGQEIYEVCSHVFINPRLKVTASDRRAG